MTDQRLKSICNKYFIRSSCLFPVVETHQFLHLYEILDILYQLLDPVIMEMGWGVVCLTTLM